MHRLIRCLFVVSAIVLALLLTISFQEAKGQEPSAPSTPQANPAKPAVPAIPPASPPAATAKVVKPKPRVAKARHVRRRTHVRPTVALSPIELPPPYPGRLGDKLHLSDGHRVWYATRHQLGVSYAPGGTDDSPYGSFQFVVDKDILRAYLVQLAADVHRSPVGAHPVAVDSHSSDNGEQPVPASIVPARDGEALDIDATEDLIKNTIESDPGLMKIMLPVNTHPAKVTADSLDGVDTRLGYFVTRFNPGEVGRTQTVRLAISIIDGTVVDPSKIFSINKVVGERTAIREFGMGHVFLNGKMADQLGGGMCQVATTLFNAAMLADLKIVERHQHVRTVPYVTPGRDATVYWGSKDFKIQNDTQYPLYISYVTTYSHAIVGLYGHGVPGRKVKLVSHSEQIAERHFKGVFYRIVYEPDGTVQKDKPYYSDYQWTPALDYTR